MINQLNGNTFFFLPPASRAQDAVSSGSTADSASSCCSAQTDAMPAPPPGREFAPEMFENHMNEWYRSRAAFENDLKTSSYNQALENWKLNNEQRQALGLPLTPKPEAAVLARVEPMPAGFWFKSGIDGSNA